MPLSSGRYPKESVSLVIGVPFHSASPSSGCIIPRILRIVVVFPAPFVPKRPNTPGLFIAKDKWSTAIFSPNFFVISLTSNPILRLLIFSFHIHTNKSMTEKPISPLKLKMALPQLPQHWIRAKVR